MTFYYKSKDKYELEYQKRKDGISSYQLPIKIKSNDSFICFPLDLVNVLNSIYKKSDELNSIIDVLPEISSTKYLKDCLIEEVILTNKIEGVHSTRKEITDIIEKVPSKNIKRFEGLVQKYLVLINQQEEIQLNTCKDIRNLYNEIVLPEIEKEDAPDGDFFRKGPVSVYSETQKLKHQGTTPPEKNIIISMEHALYTLNDEKLPELVRIAIFHYYMGYIHPFYDGNGRLSRFISSYLIAKNINAFVGLRLSYMVKERQSEYYTAFDISNDLKNKGDLTSFVLSFLDFIHSSIENLIEKMKFGLEKLNYYYYLLDERFSSQQNLYKSILFTLVQNALFSERAMDMHELCDTCDKSIPTIKKAINEINEKQELITKYRDGHKIVFKINLEELEQQFSNN